MQINNIGQLLAALKVPIPKAHQPSVPSPAATPPPEKNKVVSIPTRVAVNKQAAMVTSPARCWLSKPLPPEKPRNPHQEEIDLARADLKIERNHHAETRDELGAARQKNRELHLELLSLKKTIEAMRAEMKEKDGIIRQLEDLKL